MRTEQLEYIVDLKATLSLTKTAENFLTSHQVINHAIKGLEAELNVAILERSHRGISFTAAGLLICRYAEQTLAQRGQLIDALTPYANPAAVMEKGELHIYTIPRFINKYFLSFYNNYRKQNPKLTISLKNASLSFILDHIPLDDTTIILAAINAPSLASPFFIEKFRHLRLSCAMLLTQPLGICISAKSKYLPDVTPQNIAHLPIPIVAFNYSADENMLLANKADANAYYLIDNFDIQKQMIKSGDYAGYYTVFEYERLFKNDPSLIFIDKPSPTLFCYVALYSSATALKPAAQKFIGKLQELFRSQPVP